ncbi:hypothetical protein UB46_19750 [Burkholderiaceae bacterium 16]|nr:hypothetical protein UB46_19750 [Burkholderiaceae bacterium 16]
MVNLQQLHYVFDGLSSDDPVIIMIVGVCRYSQISLESTCQGAAATIGSSLRNYGVIAVFMFAYIFTA